MSAQPVKIMVVEDERIVAFNLRERLTRLGYEVTGLAASGEEALHKAREGSPDLILMDIRIEGPIDGIETARRLGDEQPTPVIYLTAHSEDKTIERARLTEPYGYLLKPFSERELHATIQMAMRRHETECRLQVSEERLRMALDAADMGAWDFDPASSTISLTGKTQELLGFQDEATTWESLIDHVADADRTEVRKGIDHFPECQNSCRIEFRRSSRADSLMWLRMHGKVATGRRVHPGRLVGVVQDITGQRRAEEAVRQLNADLERRVEERTAELAASNTALEMFNHSIVHDLRGPVRRMAGFSEGLIQDLAGKVDDQALKDLERIRAAATQLEGLIEGLRAISSLTNAELNKQPVNLSEIATRIARHLKSDHPERQVAFSIAENMLANADPALIEDVLQNLLSNAWKYSSHHTTARIEFGVISKHEGGHYFVRDNGAGFDMKHAAKLFRPFGRLHTNREFEGTGIGLSTVKRIIERHGGQIWVDAAVEKGATFYFTLPTPPSAD
jgi:PAS domain S-box-containing protein